MVAHQPDPGQTVPVPGARANPEARHCLRGLRGYRGRTMSAFPPTLARPFILLCLLVMTASAESTSGSTGNTATAVLGGGCFWCVEAVFERMDGVVAVESGYAGGTTPDPTYRAVTSGQTGHAEVVRITYDPETVTFPELLDLFWRAHDPTTLNRQGADVGTQYRSIILYQDQQQKEQAEASKAAAQAAFDDPIVTRIEPLETFYKAEGYHQDYYANNPGAGYCTFVIAPKLEKLGL
jgi:peptide-methionine (S)-S-oxide reductase